MQKRGFTLIELLVVIAIIGLLATFAVVQFSGAKEKARLAKAAAVSGQQLRAIGDDAQMIWNFDDCSGTTVDDLSGNGNDGILTGTSWSTDTHDGKGCSISLTNPTGYYTSSKAVTVPQNNMTLSAWFKVTVSADQSIITITSAVTRLDVYQTHMRICIAGAYCTPIAVSPGQVVVNDGKWHFATMVGDSKSIRVYVDGSSVADLTGAASAAIGNTVITSYFTGLVDDVFVFNRALTAEEVHRLYVDGLNPGRIARK